MSAQRFFILVQNLDSYIMNSFVEAWLEASSDLGIEVIHPFTFQSTTGEFITIVGVYLPDFGSVKGTLLTCRFDSDEVYDLLDKDKTGFHQSGLNPNSYEPYNRDVYVETLNDWGWYGLGKPPHWYSYKY